MSGKYDDIIDLPHHRSENRPHMTNLQRAAQFSAFSALKGFDEEIAETARYTEEAAELSEERKGEIGNALARLKAGDKVVVTYFVPDLKKAGGAYLQKSGRLKKIDENAELLEFSDGEIVAFREIAALSDPLRDDG